MSGRSAICLLLILNQLFLPVLHAEAPPPTPNPTPNPLVEKSLAEQDKKIKELKAKTLASYYPDGFKEDEVPPQLVSDINYILRIGLATGMLEMDFAKWWEKKKLETIQKLKSALGDNFLHISVSNLAASVFTAYVAEQIKEKDAADPKTEEKKKKGEPTEGDNWLVHLARNAFDHPWASAALAGAANLVVGIFMNVFNTFWHGFVAGPIATTQNAAFEPLSKPVQDYIRQKVNKTLARRKWVRRWTNYWTGEESKRQAAEKAAASGDKITGDAAHYDMPGVTVEDLTNDSRIFFHEMLAADIIWRGWTLDEVARARQTGFMILFEQPRLIGEQIMNAQKHIRIIRIEQTINFLPPLLKGGATEQEIKQYNALMEKAHLLKKYESLGDPGIWPLKKEMHEITEKWQERGISLEDIQAYNQSEEDYLLSRDQAAFVLASVLYGELYFQEYNRALGELHQIQQWQELSREMIGFYEALGRHKERIELYFKKRGMKYDVQARINERGYPLGGHRRPEEMKPFEDPMDVYFRTRKFPDREDFQPYRIGPEPKKENKEVDETNATAEAKVEMKESDIPQYRWLWKFRRDLTKDAKRINALLEKQATSPPDPALDEEVQKAIDGAWHKITGAPPTLLDVGRAIWMDLSQRRFPRINARLAEMRLQGELWAQKNAGLKLRRRLDRNPFSVACVKTARRLAPAPAAPPAPAP